MCKPPPLHKPQYILQLPTPSCNATPPGPSQPSQPNGGVGPSPEGTYPLTVATALSHVPCRQESFPVSFSSSSLGLCLCLASSSLAHVLSRHGKISKGLPQSPAVLFSFFPSSFAPDILFSLSSAPPRAEKVCPCSSALLRARIETARKPDSIGAHPLLGKVRWDLFKYQGSIWPGLA